MPLSESIRIWTEQLGGKGTLRVPLVLHKPVKGLTLCGEPGQQDHDSHTEVTLSAATQQAKDTS